MKNYFTDEQLQEMINSTDLKGRDVIHSDYCDGITREDLLALMNLAVSTAIGEPVAFINNESIWRLKRGGNDSKGTVPVHAKPSRVTKEPLYTIKELPNG
jgi:hypothetical protein